MGLWNPGVSDFNNPNFILLKDRVSQRPCVWGARLLQVGNIKAGAVVLFHRHLPNKTKQEKRRHFISTYNVLKLFFLLKEMWVVKAEAMLQCQRKKWVRCGGILHGNTAVPCVPCITGCSGLLMLCGTDSAQQIVGSCCSSAHHGSGSTCRLLELKHRLCAWV